MRQKQRKSFQEILCEEAPRNALKLEVKARSASWLAKIQPQCSRAMYSIKHAALRQLFQIPEHAPAIHDAWVTGRGFLLSIRLAKSGAWLHLPFDQLKIATQRACGAWIARRARGKHWEGQQRILRSARQSAGAWPVRSAQ